MMGRLCVMTSQAKAYYSLVSRLRKAGLPFTSVVPGTRHPPCDLVLTTRAEAGSLGPGALPVELLDDDPFVFKGQVLSRLDGGRETLLIGVDPGRRIGMAAYYGSTNLEFNTFGSAQSLCARVAALAGGVPSKRSLVRIGNGNSALAVGLALSVAERVPNASIEVVDEAGTSARGVKMKGVQGDQRAAARIAFRKGVPFSAPPRSRASGGQASQAKNPR
jgi:hypothetical protein